MTNFTTQRRESRQYGSQMIRDGLSGINDEFDRRKAAIDELFAVEGDILSRDNKWALKSAKLEGKEDGDGFDVKVEIVSADGAKTEAGSFDIWLDASSGVDFPADDIERVRSEFRKFVALAD